ncbi:hypothetical protein ElyMa_004098800 [Elysia marginata]|uniref:Uncharacterized protein n=1 Tax=Elysia marginata TaxID=1093978 RepID=A0AAV4GAH5_9GAST|nr:hypothetical protein ElyMa_004098800 [Elysia marginata]
MRGSPEKTDTGQTSVLSDGDKKMIEQVSQPEHRPRLRSRFLSISKSRRPHRRSRSKLSQEGRLLVDDFYSKPAKRFTPDNECALSRFAASGHWSLPRGPAQARFDQVDRSSLRGAHCCVIG